MSIGSLCTGYGGLDMAAQKVFGGQLRWVSDVDPGPTALLAHHYPDVPNLGDLKVIDWEAVQPVNLFLAGYPCQPFSNAGKRLGTEDPRHLWPWIARAIGVLRPRIVVLENVAAHLRKGFDVVLADLAELGYDVAWTVIRASDVGAPHRRARLFIVAANTNSRECDGRQQDTIRESVERAAPAGHRREAAPDTLGRGLREQPGRSGRPSGEGPSLVGGDREAATDTDSPGLEGTEPARGHELPAWSGAAVDWQEFEPAIRRWERRLGRLAPEPSVLGPRGGVKVAPAFGEWLMGLPEGHITNVPGLSINEQLKLVGNGVVPQQAEYAIQFLSRQLEIS